jgi:hypothetical protein
MPGTDDRRHPGITFGQDISSPALCQIQIYISMFNFLIAPPAAAAQARLAAT